MPEETTTTKGTMSAPESGVTVRMYRPGGLGDCFLLAFPAGDGTARYVLIDCGVFLGTENGADRMRRIAQDIVQATGNHLHVIVATHEHWDHLSGFQYAQGTFDEIDVDQVWLGWTEDPDDPLADRLREKRTRALRALYAASAALQAADDPMRDAVEGLLSFFGPPDTMLAMRGTTSQLEYVGSLVDRPRYCRPGDPPLTLPDVPSMQAYVLGPPRDEALLTRSDPSMEGDEAYGGAFDYDLLSPIDELAAFCDAALAAKASENLSRYERLLLLQSDPFDPMVGIRLSEAEKHPKYGSLFKNLYGFGPETDGHGPSWRRIDRAWLASTAPLALRLDRDTNNTGLVLAFELAETAKVLLFAADAQVGSWLSWHDVCWRREGGGKGDMVTGSDLVRRTVLYKVGHHGSHNATLREKGLEMMESPELTAMIPVYEEQAAHRDWLMPFPPLLERLEAKTRGRILRADAGLPERSKSLSSSEWKDFCANVESDPGKHELWIQYTIPD